MLAIFAHSMLTATRQDCTQLHDLPNRTANGKRRWLRRKRCVDLNKL